jgi:hypothetical protein
MTPTLPNRIQGRNLERLAALSDGIFAVAMTLLVLDPRIPIAAQAHSEGDLLLALGATGPQWIAYGMSFLTLGIFWAGQQTQFNHIAKGTRDLTWIHLGLSLLPPRPPERTHAQVQKQQHQSGRHQKLLMIGSVQIAGPGAPYRLPEHQHKDKEKKSGDFEEDLASHAAEWTQKAANSARQAARRTPRRFPRCSRPRRIGHALDGHGTGGSRLSVPRQPLPGHAPCDAHADSQSPADGLRFHSRL